MNGIPRGIEVLVKKASVDPDFKATLLARRSRAAAAIGLTLGPAEAAMLDGIPTAQLDAIVANTRVAPRLRPAFAGYVAAAMFAALTAVPVACDEPERPKTLGLQADRLTGPKLVEIIKRTIAPASFGLSADPVDDGRDAEDPRPDQRGKFVVLKLTDYDGAESYDVVGAAAYRARVDETRRINRVMRQAYAEAKKAWGEDKKNEGEPFPLKAPTPLRLSRLSTYSARDRADAAAEKRQDGIDKRAEREEEREKRRLERLSEAAREREQAKIKLHQKAVGLFEQKLKALINPKPEPKPDPKPRPDIITRGVRPR